jgi:hypothetical protein
VELALFDVEAPAAVDVLVGSCTGAGHGNRYTADQVAEHRRTLAYVPCRVDSCRAPAIVHRVRGTVTAARCNATCTGAMGPRCDCACGGRRHGSAWSF